MKTRGITIAASALTGFGLWRLWERGRLSKRFVQADISPQDAAIATEQYMPFFSFLTYSQVENTVESAAASFGQTPNQAYQEFAADAYLVSQGRAVG